MERKAFDLTRYPEGNLKPIERDAAALVIESSGNIHSFFLALLPDSTVVNPALSKTKDVTNFYSDETLQSTKEKQAGLKIRQALIDEPEGTIFAWVSPPEGEFDYKEARFEIGRVR